MKVTLVVPTLNEYQGMQEIMPRVKNEWVDQILVVDGQSTDGTVEYAKEQGYDVVVQKKMGMRHA
ncbi:MAG: glycosyltransferase, partial [Candidatus Omnitrophica bacterium]|nr:glycosyltransferase [Candidatus Omnitrophota bacterium]